MSTALVECKYLWPLVGGGGGGGKGDSPDTAPDT